jgi:terminase small subunit / prophage DNA-packing protein
MINAEFDDLIGFSADDMEPNTLESARADAATNECAALAGHVTSDALGALVGIAGRNVRELAKRGIIERSGPNQYDVGESISRYCAHLREIAAGRTTSATLTGERVRIATATAEKLEMANSIASREMLPAKEVERAWSGVLRDVRSAMLALPSRIGMRLSQLSPHDISEIDREIREALAEVAK